MLLWEVFISVLSLGCFLWSVLVMIFYWVLVLVWVFCVKIVFSIVVMVVCCLVGV